MKSSVQILAKESAGYDYIDCFVPSMIQEQLVEMELDQNDDP